jgi:hypothetical protein
MSSQHDLRSRKPINYSETTTRQKSTGAIAPTLSLTPAARHVTVASQAANLNFNNQDMNELKLLV